MSEIRQRKADKLFNLVDMTKLFIFLIGGLTAGTGVSFLAPTNAQLGIKVDSISERIAADEKEILECRKRIDLRSMRVENYIKAHADQEELQKELFNREIKHLNEKLDDMKDDLKEIKNLIKNGH